MILGISGSQGQGKTSLIKELEKVDGREILAVNLARKVMADLNLTLDEININLEKKILFQDQLLTDLKKSYTEEKIMSSNIYLLDRTYIDLFVYTLVGLGQYNKYDSFINEYYEKCVAYQKDIGATYILTGRQDNVQNDGIRGHNIYYSNMINSLILFFADKMIVNFYSVLNLTSLNDKVRTINSYMDLIYSEGEHE